MLVAAEERVERLTGLVNVSVDFQDNEDSKEGEKFF